MVKIVLCFICNKDYERLYGEHFKKHNITTSQYRQQFPFALVDNCQEVRICKQCNSKFIIPKKELDKFCNGKCYYKYKIGKTFEEQFGIEKAKILREQISKRMMGNTVGKNWDGYEEHMKKIHQMNIGADRSWVKRTITPETRLKYGWNRGKTKETDERVRKNAESIKRKYAKIKLGKTWEQFLGEEKAKQARIKLSKAKSGENHNFFGKKRPDQSEKMKLEKHPNWQGGKSFEPYPINFNRYLKRKIVERDNHTCQECNYHEKQLKFKLHIHHIDYNKNNNQENNLISLCGSCHMQTNFNRDDWASYFKEKVNKQANV